VFPKAGPYLLAVDAAVSNGPLSNHTVVVAAGSPKMGAFDTRRWGAVVNVCGALGSTQLRSHAQNASVQVDATPSPVQTDAPAAGGSWIKNADCQSGAHEDLHS
jgi:hypothetical protein